MEQHPSVPALGDRLHTRIACIDTEEDCACDHESKGVELPTMKGFSSELVELTLSAHIGPSMTVLITPVASHQLPELYQKPAADEERIF